MQNISDKDIENIIDKKINQAKLERYEEQLIIAKNQLNFFFKIGGAILAVVGVIFPILVTIINTERVNTAIEFMEKRIEKSLELQNKRPKLMATINNRRLIEGESLIFNYKIKKDAKSGKIIRKFLEDKPLKIEIHNVGTGPAKDVRILLFLQADSFVNWKYPTGAIGWKKWYYSNEPNYPTALTYVIDYEAFLFILDATELIPVYFNYKNFAYFNENVNRIPVILKVFFGEPQPLSIPFNETFEKIAFSGFVLFLRKNFRKFWLNHDFLFNFYIKTYLLACFFCPFSPYLGEKGVLLLCISPC